VNREAFLARVRQAAHAGRSHRVQTREVAPGTGYLGVRDDDLCRAFAAEVNEVGGVAELVSDDDEARAALAAVLELYQARSALCWQHSVLDRLGLPGLLAERSVTALAYDAAKDLAEEDRRERWLAADVAVSSVELAIAETGTLLVCSAPGRERVASLLPPVHVAIVERSQIVPDLFDAMREIEGRGTAGLPSNIALITGPSKTGDIELKLSTGVHGPGKWHVIILVK